MRISVLARTVLAVTLTGAFAASASAATEIQVWHSLKGVAADELASVTDRFNSEQAAVHVTLTYKGSPLETAKAGVAVARTKDAPDLIQLQDENTSRLASIRGAMRPIYEILPLSKSKDFQFFIPASVEFMKDSKGKLEGFPLMAAVPVFLYNRDAYKKVGLDPDAPAKTWKELQGQLVSLQDRGYGFACPYTTSEQSWIHVENLAMWHGEAIATKNNGLEGSGAVLIFNDLLHVRHIALLESWVRANLFAYSGHEHEGDVKFASGECATLTTSSDAIGDIVKAAKFQVGVGAMPFYTEGVRQPVNTLVSGSALWAMEGKKPEEYHAVSEYLAFLATPVVAAEWTQKVGSVPLTTAAFAASETSAAYQSVPGLAELMRVAATSVGNQSRGIRLPHFDLVRDEIDAQLEQVWLGKEAAKEALDDAVRDGNLILREPEGGGPPPPPEKAAPKKNK